VPAFSLVLNVVALCVIAFDAIVAGRIGITQAILAFALAVGAVALFLERPSWFRTLAMIPLGFVAIFGLVFLAMFLFDPQKYGGWLESVRVVYFLAAIGVNMWVINELAPRSDRQAPFA